ncbi:FecR family protein [Echinicola sediminis]
MKEKKPEIVDLLSNEQFIQWVISPNDSSNHYWRNWISQNENRRRDLEYARKIISSSRYEIDEELSEQDYDLLLNNIVRHNQKVNQRREVGYSRRRMLGIAATLLLLFAASLTLYLGTGEEQAGTTTVERIQKTALNGQRLRFRLPDGSKVILNSGSELSYTLPFKEHRSIRLEGEAFFEVTPDKDHPFKVYTGEVLTQVLGTSFNVKAYPEEQQRAIAVVSGKVAVSDDFGNQALLTPSLKGVFNSDDQQLLVTHFSEEKELGWKDGILQFDHAPVEKLIKELERWYGVEMIVEEQSILQGNYTGSYKNASFEKAMKGICFTMGLEYTIEEDKVRLFKQK